MQEVILKAVANPPRILWGPFLPTMLNIGVQFPLMFMFIGTFDINPLLFLISIAIGHIVCVYIGVKEPHASAMLQAYGQTAVTSHNLYKQKGNKFAP